MAKAFNLMRSNDLIWPYVINNYLRGKQPVAFDMLYWNSDATRMPAANHSFYLRDCYLDNRLSKGKMEIANVKLDLSQVKVPIYNLATREDHIAPARSVLLRLALFRRAGEIRAVGLRPHRRRRQPAGQEEISVLDRRQRQAATISTMARKGQEHPGSWWPDWLDWLKAHDAEMVPRAPGGGKLKPIEDAPGAYVKVRSWS